MQAQHLLLARVSRARGRGLAVDGSLARASHGAQWPLQGPRERIETGYEFQVSERACFRTLVCVEDLYFCVLVVSNGGLGWVF